MSLSWMETLLASVVIGLATYALAQAIAWQDGPFGLLEQFRVLAGVYEKEEYARRSDNLLLPRPKTQFGRLVECPYCLGFWISFFLTLPVAWALPLWPLVWLAAYGIQTHLQHRAER